MKIESAQELVATIEGIKAYQKAYGLISSAAKKDRYLGRIAPVMLSFAFEKLLKALGLFYDPTSKRIRGHDLVKIFERLDKKTKEHLILYSDSKPRHFWRMLHTNNRAFETWRYIEEPKAAPVFFIDDQIMLKVLGVGTSLLYTVVLKEARSVSGRKSIRSRVEAEHIITRGNKLREHSKNFLREH